MKSNYILICIPIFLILLLSACNKTHNGNNAKDRGDEYSVYSIKLGDTKDMVIDKLGIPTEKKNKSYYNIKATFYEYNSVSFVIYEDKVISIISTDLEFETQSGIGINSTYTQLEDTYPNGFLYSNRNYIIPFKNTTLIFKLGTLYGNNKRESIVTGIEYFNDSYLDEPYRQEFIQEIKLDLALTGFARKNDMKKVKDLIKKGANPAKVVRDVEGEGTPLIYASSNGNYEMVKLLLDAGAGYNMNEIEIAIKYAVIDGYEDIVKALLAEGIDINYSMLQRFSIGSSPLEVLDLARRMRQDLHGVVSGSENEINEEETNNEEDIISTIEDDIRPSDNEAPIPDLEAQSQNYVCNSFESDDGIWNNEIYSDYRETYYYYIDAGRRTSYKGIYKCSDKGNVEILLDPYLENPNYLNLRMSPIPFFYNGWIYFGVWGEPFTIWRISDDGRQLEKLKDYNDTYEIEKIEDGVITLTNWNGEKEEFYIE